MKKIFLLILLMMSSIFIIQAQTNVYQKLSGENNWGLIGKCEEGLIYQRRAGDEWGLVGKCENNMIYQKLGRKNSFGEVGKYEDGLVYQKVGRNGRLGVIGKYEDGLIYQKRGGKDSWGVVGKYEGCHGEAAFLLLFLN